MDLSNENMVHIKGKEIEYLQFRKLLEFKNIINCYTLSSKKIDFKVENNSELDKSYKEICNALNIGKESIVRPHQSHTDKIEKVENSKQKFVNVDGLLTNKKDISLMLTYADCTPILLFDPINNCIGNIHSGWRGTAQKIGQKGALNLINMYNCKPENMLAFIGPCIGKCHFEVDEDVKNIFEETFGYLKKNKYIITNSKTEDGKFYIDTTLINRMLLQEVGLKSENIYESGICTVCNKEIIHSYRANGKETGRNVAILGLK